MLTGQVFVSHTSDMALFPEGRSFVQAALDGVGRAGMASVDMRYFAARDGKPAALCRQRVRGCEIYVGVVGFRYGSMVPGEAVSYTEMEFDEAGAAGLQRLVFLLHDTACPAALVDADRGAVAGFRQRLMDAGLVVRAFTSAADLELEVFHALTELAGSALAAVPGAAVPGPAVRHSLPPDTAAFTGRDDELRHFVAAVTEASGSGGVVAIHAIGGMPGVGKTALAVHVAHLLRDRFPDRQLFIDLHGHTPGQDPVTPETVLAGLLTATGVDARYLPDGLDGLAGLWRDRIAGQRILLVLDNAASSGQVAPLVPGGVGCLVLVTSRRHLGDLPGPVVPVLLDALPPEQAREMFLRLAPRAATEPDAVLDLARLAGYLPLAISLLARVYAKHPSWTLTDLTGETRESLLTLAAEKDSVAAAFDVSYRHLPGAQQRFFRRIGLHPGTSTDACAAAALAGVPLRDAAGYLDALHGEGLLTEAGYRRYGMHDLIRRYAQDLASADSTAECDQAVRRILDYYLHAAWCANQHIARSGPIQPPALAAPPVTPDLSTPQQAFAWMQEEWPNLSAAADYARDQGITDVLRSLAAALHGFLRTQGYWIADAELQRAAAAAAREDADRFGHAASLVNLADAQYLLDQHPAARESLAHALDLYGKVGHRGGRADALTVRGDVERQTGAHKEARRTLEEAVSLYETADDPAGRATALTYLGDVCMQAGEFTAADHALRQALGLFRDLGQPAGQARALMYLGDVQRQSGAYEDATQTLSAALGLFTEHGDRLGQANARVYLGIAQYISGQPDQAVANLQHALGLQRTLGDRLGLAGSLTILGDVLTQTGHLDAATGNIQQALELFRDLGHLAGQANTLNYLGNVQRLTGDLAGAQQSLQTALDLFTELAMPAGRAEARNHLGELMSARGQPDEAIVQHTKALKIARQIESPLDEAHALDGIASACRARAQPSEEARYLRQALQIYERIKAPAAERVRQRLSQI